MISVPVLAVPNAATEADICYCYHENHAAGFHSNLKCYYCLKFTVDSREIKNKRIVIKSVCNTFKWHLDKPRIFEYIMVIIAL